jgi:hypothetical protein
MSDIGINVVSIQPTKSVERKSRLFNAFKFINSRLVISLPAVTICFAILDYHNKQIICVAVLMIIILLVDKFMIYLSEAIREEMDEIIKKKIKELGGQVDPQEWKDQLSKLGLDDLDKGDKK